MGCEKSVESIKQSVKVSKEAFDDSPEVSSNMTFYNISTPYKPCVLSHKWHKYSGFDKEKCPLYMMNIKASVVRSENLLNQ